MQKAHPGFVHLHAAVTAITAYYLLLCLLA